MNKQFQKICSQLRSSSINTNSIDEIYFKGEPIKYNVDIKTKLNKLTDDIIEVAIVLKLNGINANDESKEYLVMDMEFSGHYQVVGYSAEEIETVAFAFAANDLYPSLKLYASQQCHFLQIPPPNLAPVNFAEIIKKEAV